MNNYAKVTAKNSQILNKQNDTVYFRFLNDWTALYLAVINKDTFLGLFFQTLAVCL